MYEIIGYVASVLVAISLMMSSILRLRIINLLGSVIFAIYGVLIGAIPVAAVNTFIAGVNVFYLYRIFGTKEYFRVLEAGPGSEYLDYFLSFNREDIARHIPEFDARIAAGDLVFFVLRGTVPAGLVVGRPDEEGSLCIRLDYVQPGYRDFKVGEFLYRERAAFFRERGIERLVMRASTPEHTRYVERMGFIRDADGVYVRELDTRAARPARG
jgi:GNAT superfamily N-acetyltransferase